MSNDTKTYKAFQNAIRFKENRMKQGSLNVEMYNLKQEDEQIGFLSVPTTDMHSFVEDWCARMPELKIRFKALKPLADAEAEKKINALLDRDSLPQNADYQGKNRAVNKYACLYGAGIAKVWSESNMRRGFSRSSSPASSLVLSFFNASSSERRALLICISDSLCANSC